MDDAAEPNYHLTLIGRRRALGNNLVDAQRRGAVKVKTGPLHPCRSTPTTPPALGLTDGGQAEVASRVGKVVAP